MPDVIQGLGQGIATFALEIVALIIAIFVLKKLLPRGFLGDSPLFAATAIVVGVAILLIAAEGLATSGDALVHAQRASVSNRQGIDHCFVEEGAEDRIPFVERLRIRMPPHAVYVLSLAGEPDAWCVTLALLPRVPAYGNAQPGWVVFFGDIPPAQQQEIARHDPAIEVFAPGLALEQLRP